MTDHISYYSRHAEELTEQYNSLAFESVHKEWLSLIPKDGMVLDVGAGSGRDARFLDAKGLRVVAVEPAQGIRELAKRYNKKSSVHWVDDSLPELSKVFALEIKFDLILLSAVWMHIAPSARERSIRRLSSLLKPGGKIVISLRHGASTDGRTMLPVSAEEIFEHARNQGLSCRLVTPGHQPDQLRRKDVKWQTVVLSLPDDGTGAFSLIRNIVINDSKSSTYKVALLRALLRLAEGHPGAVLDRTEDHIVLPIGLISLYWLKLFKPLIDQYGMQQNASSNKGLGFIKPNGWRKLESFLGSDFYLGARYTDLETSVALYQTLKDISSTIKLMPAKYTTSPNTGQPLFHVELNRTCKPAQSITLDFSFLVSFGKFYVPKSIWDSLCRYSVWIEPALVNEWANLMSGYRLNKERNFSHLDFLEALKWDAPERNTARVRQRVINLLESHPLACCWSGKSIKQNNFAIDHAFPFSRWPNNDLWNLLPTRHTINSKKSDKLPSTRRIHDSRNLITHWWELAWKENTDEFFVQANLSLPSLHYQNRSYEDVFEAFTLQRDRIRDLQQLQEWY